MLRIGIVWGGLVTAMAVALAVNSAVARSATSEQAGKPLALLAGLRPPHESKHSVHAKTAHATIERTAAKKTRRARMAAAHTRHISAGKIAKNGHKHRERAVTASAFAEEPPAPAAENLVPRRDWPAVNTVSPAEATATPAPQTATANDDANPSTVRVDGQTVRVDEPGQINSLDLAAKNDEMPAATPTSRPDAAAAAPTALATPAHRDTSPVGSASWIAQVLAALGGAVAAGAVAWFLIGGGPLRTYG